LFCGVCGARVEYCKKDRLRYNVVPGGVSSKIVKAATLIASVLSVVIFTAFYWWFRPGLPVALLYAALCLIALTTVPLCYRLFGFNDLDILRQLQDQEQRDHDAMLYKLENLQDSLETLEIDEGARQAKKLNSLLNDFHEVIANRFDGKHLSASTYLNAARRVQQQAIQNLSDMVGIGHSITSLNRRAGNAEVNHQLDEQTTRLDQLIKSNQDLFQALTDTSIDVANMEEISSFERDETLARLNDLANLARRQGSQEDRANKQGS